MTKKLNLGCGNDYRCDYINLDKDDVPKDVEHDLDDYPWPFQDNLFDEVIMFNVLEHLESPYKAIHELNRICKDGAILKVRFPFIRHDNAFRNDDHKYVLTPEFFKLYDFLDMNNVDLHYSFPRYGFLTGWLGAIFNSSVYDEFRVELEVVK